MFFKKKVKNDDFIIPEEDIRSMKDKVKTNSSDGCGDVINNKFKKSGGKVNVQLKKYHPTKSIIKGKKKDKLKSLRNQVKPNKWR